MTIEPSVYGLSLLYHNWKTVIDAADDRDQWDHGIVADGRKRCAEELKQFLEVFDCKEIALINLQKDWEIVLTEEESEDLECWSYPDGVEACIKQFKKVYDTSILLEFPSIF